MSGTLLPGTLGVLQILEEFGAMSSTTSEVSVTLTLETSAIGYSWVEYTPINGTMCGPLRRPHPSASAQNLCQPSEPRVRENGHRLTVPKTC
jgi:hypothetical protein